MILKSPEFLRQEHEEIHEKIAELKKFGGGIESAVNELVAVLHPHFIREEEIATPPLSLLPKILIEDRPEGTDEVLKMTAALEEDLPQMLEEHKVIKEAALELKEMGLVEDNDLAIQFGDLVVRHIQQEEEVYYPVALLIGRYLQLKSVMDFSE